MPYLEQVQIILSLKKNRFKEVRQPSCGNDISYKKTGTYTMSKSKLILNYSGGEFLDNVGGDSIQVYVKSKIYFDIKRKVNDTIQILWTSGISTKNELRKDK